MYMQQHNQLIKTDTGNNITMLQAVTIASYILSFIG